MWGFYCHFIPNNNQQKKSFVTLKNKTSKFLKLFKILFSLFQIIIVTRIFFRYLFWIIIFFILYVILGKIRHVILQQVNLWSHSIWFIIHISCRIDIICRIYNYRCPYFIESNNIRFLLNIQIQWLICLIWRIISK